MYIRPHLKGITFRCGFFYSLYRSNFVKERLGVFENKYLL